MTRGNITTEHVAGLLLILKDAGQPMVAAELAVRMRMSGNRESQRRAVRDLVKHLRDTGSMIIATLQGGYWLTDDYELWTDYLTGRTIDAKRVLGESYRRKRQSRQRKQTTLFDLPTIGVDR